VFRTGFALGAAARRSRGAEPGPGPAQARRRAAARL